MARTVHVYPVAGEWAVKKEGASGKTYATEQEAIKAARETVRSASAGQVVVHGKKGQIRGREAYRMTPIQDPPKKSRLSRLIDRAVGKVALERVQGEVHPST